MKTRNHLLTLVMVISVITCLVVISSPPAFAGGSSGYNAGYNAPFFQAKQVADQIKLVEGTCQANNPIWTPYARSIFEANKARLDAQTAGWVNPAPTPTWDYILANDAGLRWLCPEVFSGPVGLVAQAETASISTGGPDQVFTAAMFQATEVASQIRIVERACTKNTKFAAAYSRKVFEANKVTLDRATLSWGHPWPTPTWESVVRYAAPIFGCNADFGAAYAPA